MTGTTVNIKQKQRLYPWLVVILLGLVGCLNYLDRTMITTMRSSIVSSLPMSDAEFGLLTSCFLWIYGVLSPLGGFLADRFNRSRVIIFSLFVWSAVTWLTAHVQTYEQLLLTRALMGISEACYIPAALALIADYHHKKTRSLATGIHMCGVMAGQSLGFVGGWLADKHSWQYAFSIFGVIGVAYAIILLFSLRDPIQITARSGETDEPRTINLGKAIHNLLSNRKYIRVLCYWGLLGMVSWLVVGWLPTYYQERFNLSQTMAGLYATGYFHTASLLGVLVGGILADRWSRVNKRARIILPAIGLIVAAPGMLLASGTSLLVLAVVCFMIYAFTRTFTDANMMPILCMVVDKKYRATAYGILNLSSCLIGGLGLYAGGFMRDEKIALSLIFQVASLTLLICALLLFKLKPNPHEMD